jgi:hypothetical protein
MAKLPRLSVTVALTRVSGKTCTFLGGGDGEEGGYLNVYRTVSLEAKNKGIVSGETLHALMSARIEHVGKGFVRLCVDGTGQSIELPVGGKCQLTAEIIRVVLGPPVLALTDEPASATVPACA